MTRLQSELHRLYFPHPTGGPGAGPLVDAEGRVRAMVLELARPADWEVLAKVWRGVQVDLALPAPAIAVSGGEGLQLWFSLSEAVAAPQAAAFLERLRLRYLPDVAPKRVGLMPGVETGSPQPVRHARPVPAQDEQTGNWSAFVAADLAPVFADTPWLDIEPGPEGQADLLSRLESIKPAAFEAASAQLGAATPQSDVPSAPSIEAGPAPAGPRAPADCMDPRHFLLQVMNDPTVALALRIEAAKALLTCPDPGAPRPG